MHEIPPFYYALFTVMFLAYGIVFFVESEYRNRTFIKIIQRWLRLPLPEGILLAVFLTVYILWGGGKTNQEDLVIRPPEAELYADSDGMFIEGGSQFMSEESGPRLTTNQYAAGFALLSGTETNAAPWLAVPSNAVTHVPWTHYGLTEDTFWLPATNWSFILGTNAVDGVHVSSSGTLSFGWPKGSPRAAEMPDGIGINFLAPLQGSLGTLPPEGRFWHAVTGSNSVLFTWQDVFAGRDTHSPITFQTELFGNGDFIYRYAFTNALALTNFVVGAQHSGGGETYALNDTNKLVNGLELRWRAFGVLDPNVEDHDGDGLSTYSEVMTYGTDPSMPDTDLDGLSDFDEVMLAGTNPLLRDTDGDGIPDGGDPDPLSADTADLDGDGLPDAWETHWFGSTNATDSADADTNADGLSDQISLLASMNPAFSACAVTASHGGHTFTWTDLPDATNYAASVSNGNEPVWSCATNVCVVSVTGDFSSAVHTLTVTSYGGVTSRTASVTFRQPSQSNLTVWKIADPFALELPQGCTNVLGRTFQISRADAWQQYFVSSGHDSAGAWALEGLRLDWSDSGGASGSAAASPAGDSLRLAVSTNSPQTLTVTVRIVPDGAGGLARSPKPLYLLRWSPAVAFSSTGTVSAVTENGTVAAAVSDRSGGDTAAAFTVDLDGRPCNATPSAAEIAQQSDPFAVGSGVSFEGSYGSGGGLSGGTVKAGGPGLFGLSCGFTSDGGGDSGGGGSDQPPPPAPPLGGLVPPVALLLISPSVAIDADTGYCSCSGSEERSVKEWPFGSGCLRRWWQNGGGCGEYLSEPGGFTVTAGSEQLDALVAFLINGAETPSCSHAWVGNERSATIALLLGDKTLWSTIAEREPAIFDNCGGESGWEDDDECGCNGCEDGDCSTYEGDELSSLRFRLPLGITGYRQLAGFVWFDMETPQTVTPALFTVTGNDFVTCSSNGLGGALSEVVCEAAGGRTVTLGSLSSPAGVALTVYEHGEIDPSHTWEITNLDGPNTTIRVVRKDGSGTIVRDALYTCTCGDWSCVDSLTGAAESIVYGSLLDSGGYDWEKRTITDSGGTRQLSQTETARETVGSGTAAVTRDTFAQEKVGGAREWEDSVRETAMTWWEDSLNPLVNGLPKFRYGNDGSWEYRAFDARGRETLRAEPLDGSAHPFFKDDAAPFALDPAATYGSFTGLVAVTSYAPAPGDSDALNDSRKPREVSVYAVTGGAPALVSREWRVFTRGVSGEFPAVTRTTVRAASPSSAFADPANAVSVTVSVAEDDASVPVLLRGRPLLETGAGGVTNSYAYDFGGYDPGTRSFTADPSGAFLRAVSSAASAPLRETEISDAVFGRVLLKETRHTVTGEILSWETREYDSLGRRVSSAFSDGTAETDGWGCCRLDATVRRDGTRVETWEIPGFPLWSAEAETSLGSLPGLNGCHPVTEIYADALGRVTNTVLSVWNNGSPSSAHARISTTTEYPYGTSDYMVTTDPFGTQTVYFVTLAGSARITTTRTPGVTNSVTQYYGGSTVYTSCTTNGVATTTYATAYATNGCRVETVSVVTNGVAVTNIVTEYDFLGNPVVTADPAAAVPASTVSYQQVSNIWYRTCVGSIVTNGVTNTLFTAVRQLTGLSWPIQQRVTITDTNNEAVVVTVSSTSVPAVRTVTRQNLSLDTIETTAYIGIYPIYYVDNSGVTNTFFYEYDTANQITLQTQAQESFGFGILGLFPTFDEIVAMVRSHFESRRIRLTGELTSLCPEKATKLDGKCACCNPSDCKTDARIMASSYISALEAAWWARTVPVGGFIGNVMIDLAGGNGLNYPEDIAPGLVCDGWRGMAETILFPIASKSNCWTFENGTRNGLITFFTGEPAHVWAILKSTNGTIGLDPWPSGGWTY